MFDINYNEFDLEEPIFAHFIDVSNISKQRAEEKTKRYLYNYQRANLQVVMIPDNKDDFKLIYPINTYKEIESKVFELIKELKSGINYIEDYKKLEEIENILQIYNREAIIDEIKK
jgi:hypothetical protein